MVQGKKTYYSTGPKFNLTHHSPLGILAGSSSRTLDSILGTVLTQAPSSACFVKGGGVRTGAALITLFRAV